MKPLNNTVYQRESKKRLAAAITNASSLLEQNSDITVIAGKLRDSLEKNDPDSIMEDDVETIQDIMINHDLREVASKRVAYLSTAIQAAERILEALKEVKINS